MSSSGGGKDEEAGGGGGGKVEEGTAQRTTVMFLGPEVPAPLRKLCDARDDVSLLPVSTVAAGQALAATKRVSVLVAKLGTAEDDSDSGVALCAWMAKRSPQTLLVVLSATAAKSLPHRQACFALGAAHVVTGSTGDVVECVLRVASWGGGSLACPACGLDGLRPADFVDHFPLLHAARASTRAVCPLCAAEDASVGAQGDLYAHVRDAHGPAGDLNGSGGGGAPTPFFCSFGLVVVRRPSDGRFLLVDERQGRGYWLPGGGLDAREGPAEGAKRETLEEGGVDVRLTGVLRVEHWTERFGGEAVTKMRTIFLGEPVDPDAPPKGVPDWETAGSVWVTAAEVEALAKVRELRGSEPLLWIPFVANGGKAAPMQALSGDHGSLPLHDPRRDDLPVA